jgi:hypothetical protein
MHWTRGSKVVLQESCIPATKNISVLDYELSRGRDDAYIIGCLMYGTFPHLTELHLHPPIYTGDAGHWPCAAVKLVVLIRKGRITHLTTPGFGDNDDMEFLKKHVPHVEVCRLHFHCDMSSSSRRSALRRCHLTEMLGVDMWICGALEIEMDGDGPKFLLAVSRRNVSNLPCCSYVLV